MTMTELGPGVRVYVGWTDRVRPNVRHELCAKGTVYDGPFPRGAHVYDPAGNTGIVNMTGYPCWIVVMDKYSSAYPYRSVVEPLIFPLDDWDESLEEKHENLDEVGA